MGGANNGTSWANAYASLTDALTNASAGCQIWVAAGTYKPSGMRGATFFLKDNVAVYGGFTGLEDALSERNWFFNPTILSGDMGDPLYGFYNVVYAAGVTSTAVLDGFTITKGNANVEPGFAFSNCGGGIVISDASPTLNNLTIKNNHADLYGGGVYFYDSYANLANSLFALNTATYGGGIGTYHSYPTVTNVTIADNTSTYGGAVYNSQNSLPIFRNSILWSDDGGEIYNDPLFTSSTTSFTYSLVQGCSPGGVWNTAACGTDGGHNLADADPQFFDPAGGIYQLKVTSPGINRGSNALIYGYLLDMVQHPRISDFLVDLGAYEFQFHSIFLPTVTK